MKTNIAGFFGLALFLAIGGIAAMLALGMFQPSNATAATDVATNIDSQTNTPITPGDTAAFTIVFQNQDALTANSGQLWVLFDSSLSVPTSIEKERITISASGTGAVTISNPAIDPTVESDDNGDTIVKITIGDTDTSTTNVADGLLEWDDASTNLSGNSAGTAGAGGHVITFSTLAGIKNKTSASLTGAWIRLSTDNGTTYSASCAAAGDVACIPVYRWVKLSGTSGARGKVITVTGKGWDSGETATVFLDNVSGGTLNALDSTDTVLATSTETISGGEFTATITADTSFAVGANSVNAVDGTGTAANAPAQGARYVNQRFTLTGAVTVEPSSATRGATVKLTLSDYTNGAITAVSIGGVPASVPGGSTVTNNAGTISITVPASTPLGTQVLKVVGGESRTSTIVVSGLTLTASPSTAVSNQSITVSGSGFAKASDSPAGAIATITVGGITQASLTNSSAVTTVTTDNSGNLVASFKIPNDDTTRTAGTHVLRITDNHNRIGEVSIVIPGRTLTLDPSESKRSSTVDYTGSGFVASTSVTIDYDGTTVDTVTADSSGNVSGDFTVPSGSGIPSSNTVTGTSACTCTGDNVSIQLTGTATHSVPAAVVSIDPLSAASGESISVTGTGFPGYVQLEVLTIGGVSARPSPSPASDGDGLFSLTALVPELSTGSHSLVATIGTGTTAVTATTSFTVVAAVAVAVVTTNDTEDTFADEIAADNLVRVWWYSNEEQDWSFFDPRPAFEAANTYSEASSDDIVWVNVTEETTFQGATLYPGWNLISLD